MKSGHIEFEQYVDAAVQTVDEFRDVVRQEIAKASGQPANAKLYRLRMACDNFINALRGQY